MQALACVVTVRHQRETVSAITMKQVSAIGEIRICGLAKARAVLLWHALAHNLQRMIALDVVMLPT